MSIWNRLKKELIDIVQFLDDSQDTIAFRFERFQNEIKWSAKLVVREGQAAVFVNEGKIADVFQPGTYTLDTKNLPILATLQGWKYGFESPFKAEVYFISTRRFQNNKWGTMNPVMIRDKEFGPVRVRAFGTYVFRVIDPAKIVTQLGGTEGRYTVDQLNGHIRNTIVSRLGDVLGESGLPVLDMAANYDELGKYVAGRIGPEFAEIGVELSQLLIENISLPPEVEAAMDKRTSMGVIGDMNAYTKFQAAEALRDAAKNPGGAGNMVGIGLGMNMAGVMGAAMAGAQNAPAPPPLPAEAQFHVAIDGAQSGPFGIEGLRQQAASGRLTRDTLVWKAGMANWSRAGDVAELASIFAAVPPPLPN